MIDEQDFRQDNNNMVTTVQILKLESSPGRVSSLHFVHRVDLDFER